jgi:hypothetical protein
MCMRACEGGPGGEVQGRVGRGGEVCAGREGGRREIREKYVGISVCVCVLVETKLRGLREYVARDTVR